jgi:intermediate peptidase
VAAGPSPGVVDDLDEVSDTICAVVDVAEVCRNTHPDPRFVAAAERAYIALQGYVQTLNSNRGLYMALVAAQEHCGYGRTTYWECASPTGILNHRFLS